MPATARKLSIIGEDCAAAPGSYGFVAVKTQGAKQTKCAGMPAVVEAAKRFGRIFHKRKIEIVRNREQAIQISGVAKGVHGHQCPDNAPAVAVHTMARALLRVFV